MSEPSQSFEGENEGPEVEGAELQFDQAEPAAPAPSGPTCAACNRPIEDQYFEINGKVICTSCRQHIEASLRGGSGLARLLKASLFGLGAAILGAVIYFAFVKATDANWSLVAILVGFMVGGAVRKGTGNRGGLLYQILALLLTYFAIGLMGAALELESAIKEPGKNDDGRKARPGRPRRTSPRKAPSRIPRSLRPTDGRSRKRKRMRSRRRSRKVRAPNKNCLRTSDRLRLSCCFRRFSRLSPRLALCTTRSSRRFRG